MALDRAQIPLGSMMDNHGPVLLRRSSASKCEPTKNDLHAKVFMLVQKKSPLATIFGHIWPQNSPTRSYPMKLSATRPILGEIRPIQSPKSPLGRAYSASIGGS